MKVDKVVPPGEHIQIVFFAVIRDHLSMLQDAKIWTPLKNPNHFR